jgi:hypothetical protein
MLIAYGDESTDGTGKEIFAIAGLLGTQEEWDAVESAWLERTQGKIFHATDCLSGYGSYKGIPKEDRIKEYEDLTKILCKSHLWGYASAIDIVAYKNCLLHPTRHAPYLYCFTDVIMYLAWLTRLHVPQHQKIDYIFDRRSKAEVTAVELIEYFSKLPEYNRSSFLGRLTFSSIDEVGIQTADLLVHESMMSAFYDIHPEKRRPRISLSPLGLLKDAKHFEFQPYLKKYFETQYTPQLRAIEEKTGLSRKKYEDWLLKYRCSDNDRNRVRYLTYMNSVRNRGSAAAPP